MLNGTLETIKEVSKTVYEAVWIGVSSLWGNDFRCTECSQLYVTSNTKPSACPSCTTKERKCELCEDSFDLQTHYNRLNDWYFYDTMFRRCPYCLRSEKYTCRGCGDTYIATKEDEFRGNHLCKFCDKAHYYLVISPEYLPELDFKEGYRLCITYDIRQETHDGYCSEPYDEEENEIQKTYKYPLLSNITEEDIKRFMDRSTVDSSDPNPLNIYILRKVQHGNGYCGMNSFYTVKSIEICPWKLNDN